MTPYHRRGILISTVVSIVIGLTGSGIVVGSDNSYIGGINFLIVLIVMIPVSLILLISSLIGFAVKSKFAIFILIISLGVPLSFFLFSLTAKALGIGAYRDEPMIPILVR